MKSTNQCLRFRMHTASNLHKNKRATPELEAARREARFALGTHDEQRKRAAIGALDSAIAPIVREARHEA